MRVMTQRSFLDKLGLSENCTGHRLDAFRFTFFL